MLSLNFLLIFKKIFSASNDTNTQNLVDPQDIWYYQQFDMKFSKVEVPFRNECQFKRMMSDLVYFGVNKEKVAEILAVCDKPKDTTTDAELTNLAKEKLGSAFYIDCEQMRTRRTKTTDVKICENCLRSIPNIQKVMIFAKKHSMIIHKPLGKLKIPKKPSTDPSKKPSNPQALDYSILANNERKGLFIHIRKQKRFQRIRAIENLSSYFVGFANGSMCLLEKNLEHRIEIKDIDPTWVFEVVEISNASENDTVKDAAESILEEDDPNCNYGLFEKEDFRETKIIPTTVSDKLGIVFFFTPDSVDMKACKEYVENPPKDDKESDDKESKGKEIVPYNPIYPSLDEVKKAEEEETKRLKLAEAAEKVKKQQKAQQNPDQWLEAIEGLKKQNRKKLEPIIEEVPEEEIDVETYMKKKELDNIKKSQELDQNPKIKESVQNPKTEEKGRTDYPFLKTIPGEAQETPEDVARIEKYRKEIEELKKFEDENKAENLKAEHEKKGAENLENDQNLTEEEIRELKALDEEIKRLNAYTEEKIKILEKQTEKFEIEKREIEREAEKLKEKIKEEEDKKNAPNQPVSGKGNAPNPPISDDKKPTSTPGKKPDRNQTPADDEDDEYFTAKIVGVIVVVGLAGGIGYWLYSRKSSSNE